MCVKSFFQYLVLFGICLPTTYCGLDYEMSEYINHMWLEGEPHGYAAALISAMARFIPGVRSQLSTSRQYVKNLERTLTRHRALPFTKRLVVGMAGGCYAFGRDDLAVVLLVGFTCLLRTTEALSLTPGQVTLVANGTKAVIFLPQSKGCVRSGVPDQVTLEDPLVVRALARCMEAKSPSVPIYQGSAKTFGDDVRWAANLFGVSHKKLTPYGLRRGGATWHFLRYGSLDATAVLGRWEQVRTARIYIQGAAASLAEWKLSTEQQQLLQRAGTLCERVLKSS